MSEQTDLPTTQHEKNEAAKAVTRAIQALICERCGTDEDVNEYDNSIDQWDNVVERHYTTGGYVNFCSKCAGK